MRRLLILTPDFPPALGGIQRHMSELAGGLAQRWDVTVVAPRPGGSPSVAEPERAYRVLRTRSRWGRARSASSLAEMAVLGRRARPEVILAGHLAVAPAALAVAGRRPAAAIVYGGELWSSQGARMMRSAGRRLRLILCISRFTAAEAVRAGAPEDRIRLAPPGGGYKPSRQPGPALDRLGLVADPDEPRPFFLSIGRLAEPYKGEDVFIRAIPPLLARHPELRYVIAGDGPLLPHLRRIAAYAGVADALITPGAVDEQTKSALLGACRALVMLSRESRSVGQFEGFGIAYIEAALAGRPAIGGKAGGTPDAVVDGETGILVDPNDVPAVVEAAERLLDDPAHADELGRNARRRAEANHTWPHAVDRVDRLLSELL